MYLTFIASVKIMHGIVRHGPWKGTSKISKCLSVCFNHTLMQEDLAIARVLPRMRYYIYPVYS